MGIGDKKLNVDIYQFDVSGNTITVNIASDTCSLVGEMIMTPNGIINIGVLGTVLDIDENVFEVPRICNYAKK